jgi:hypothetical protein
MSTVKSEAMVTASGISIIRRVTADKAIEYTRADNEVYHREDGPAITYANGWKEWRINGALHREDDKPARTMPEGDKEWWIHGERHRAGGLPAHLAHQEPTEEERAAGKETGLLILQRWFVDGLQHREDGPANIYWNGEEEELDYWLHGHEVPEKVVMAPETITPEEIEAEAERNPAVARIMAQRRAKATRGPEDIWGPGSDDHHRLLPEHEGWTAGRLRVEGKLRSKRWVFDPDDEDVLRIDGAFHDPEENEGDD